MTLDLSTLSIPSSDTPAEDGTSDSVAVPDYFYALDSHNVGNNGFAVTDPSTWGEGLGNAGMLVVSSLASGVNSFYNTGVAVGNFFGADLEENDLNATLSSIDDNLGAYYAENKQAADLLGFIATSFIPGLGGVKILNAIPKMMKVAESGMIGGTLAKSTGLLQPAIDKYIAAAAKDIATSRATFSAIGSNSIKAVAAGFGQAALETTAFEVAVAATMFKSPVLEDQDIGDIIKNIAVGTVLGGGIIGAFSGAKLLGEVKVARTAADLAEKPFTHITELKGLTPAERVIQRYDDISNTPPAPDSGDFAQKFQRQRNDKLNKLDNLAREDMQVLTGSDSELGNYLADTLKGADKDTIFTSFLGAKEFGRINTKLQSELAEARALASKDIATRESALDTRTGYVALRGENVGKTYFEAPKLVAIADTVKNEEQALAKIANNKFKERALFDMTKVGDDHLVAEARYIWADRLAKVKPGMSIHEFDIPMLERLRKDGISDVNLVSNRAGISEYKISNMDDLENTIRVAKEEVAFNLIKQARTTEFAAVATNTKVSYLEGTRSTDEFSDLYARQDFNKRYTQQMVDKGLWSPNKGVIDLSLKPSWMKVSYDTKKLAEIDSFQLDAMSYLKAQNKLYEQSMDTVLADTVGDLSEQLIRPSEDMLRGANSYGAGAGLLKAANGNYGTLASVMESNGAVTSKIMLKFRDETRAALDSVAYKLANNTKAAIEFESISQKVSATSEHYVLDANANNTRLISRKLARYQEEVKAGKSPSYPKLQEGAKEYIAIENAETLEAIQAHIEVNGNRVRKEVQLRNVQGYTNQKDPGTFYPIRPNPKEYNHHAFVIDPKVTGSGHVTMIHAATDKDLEQLMSRVPNEFQVITKEQSKDYFKARNEFSYDRTLHENYIDSSLKKSGVNSQFFLKTDPRKIVDDWIQDQLTRDDIMARELVSGKLEKEFSELRRLGDQYTNIATSRYSGSVKQIENTVKNPYVDYIKTALNVSKISEYPLLSGLNNLLDTAFSKAIGTVDELFTNAKSPEELEAVNKALDQYGMKSAYYDSATNLYANHTASKGQLSKFIRGANSILSSLTLRMDPMNALNNVVGSNVLLGAETKYVLRALQNADSKALGPLSELLQLDTGAGSKYRSAGKLIFNSQKRFFSEEGKQLLQEYKTNGWVTDLSDQFKSVLDDITLRGNETDKELGSKLSQAFSKVKKIGSETVDKVEKWTGNKLAEEFNRFVAADVMKQITDAGVNAGVIDAKLQKSFINTFVNRTQGNYLASQRPLVFQGPIGQAVGLFQTYQFNMIQQLFRYVAEGSSKDTAMLLGLQGTIYGMNGLPAFNAINTHIVGTASGNSNHTDAYSATYGIAGKNAGDLLLYGLPSKLLGANLYTRGDINPRNPTILPVNPADIPFVSAFIKVGQNLVSTAEKLSLGGDVGKTLLQAVEHNGLSRPLAGIAQIAEGFTNDSFKSYSTSSKGNMTYANDLVSLASLTRIVGGKPLDEAVTNDALFRIKAYQASDSVRKDKLAEALKTTVIGGGMPSTEQVQNMMDGYVKAGGKQKEFNKWMISNIKNANTPQANEIMKHLNDPYAKSLQQIMGGSTEE